jgi:hypothetical protein
VILPLDRSNQQHNGARTYCAPRANGENPDDIFSPTCHQL